MTDNGQTITQGIADGRPNAYVLVIDSPSALEYDNPFLYDQAIKQRKAIPAERSINLDALLKHHNGGVEFWEHGRREVYYFIGADDLKLALDKAQGKNPEATADSVVSSYFEELLRHAPHSRPSFRRFATKEYEAEFTTPPRTPDRSLRQNAAPDFDAPLGLASAAHAGDIVLASTANADVPRKAGAEPAPVAYVVSITPAAPTLMNSSKFTYDMRYRDDGQMVILLNQYDKRSDLSHGSSMLITPPPTSYNPKVTGDVVISIPGMTPTSIPMRDLLDAKTKDSVLDRNPIEYAISYAVDRLNGQTRDFKTWVKECTPLDNKEKPQTVPAPSHQRNPAPMPILPGLPRKRQPITADISTENAELFAKLLQQEPALKSSSNAALPKLGGAKDNEIC